MSPSDAMPVEMSSGFPVRAAYRMRGRWFTSYEAIL